MDYEKQHWKILRELGTELANKVQSFMVVGEDGERVFVTTEDGEGFWLGTIRFGSVKSKPVTNPISLNVPRLVQMANGRYHIMLLTESGQIYAMGENGTGLLGLGMTDHEYHLSPKLISSPHKFTSVRCGFGHSLALTENGKVWAWGENNFCEVGVPDTTLSFPSPRQISELDFHRVVAVECGAYHSLALTDQGEVYGWGWNHSRQLGYWSILTRYPPARISTPTQICTPSPVKSMAAGFRHTLLLTRTGEVWACGDNGNGQLGSTTTNRESAILFKMADVPLISQISGLPPISQIASHFFTSLSIAISYDQRCFVWGQLHDGSSIFTPRELPSFYSTVESPLSFYSSWRSTPHSVLIPKTSSNPLSTQMSRMFGDLETSDVQFVVEQRTIYAHRNILSNSSDYFALLFSERWQPQVDPEDPIVRVTIPDHSYEVFHAFLRFLYTYCLEVYHDLLPELFELANQYLESDLEKLCISRMRDTLTPDTCCLYYQLTERLSLPELDVFQQELVQYASTRKTKIAETAAYQSMEPVVRENLTYAVGNLQGTLICHFECENYEILKLIGYDDQFFKNV